MAISEAFGRWLPQNGWSGHARTSELDRVNAYLGRAIDRCRKALYNEELDKVDSDEEALPEKFSRSNSKEKRRDKEMKDDSSNTAE